MMLFLLVLSLWYSSGGPLWTVVFLDQHVESRVFWQIVFPFADMTQGRREKMMRQNWIGLASPFFFVSMALEAILLRKTSRKYRIRDTINSASLGALNQLVKGILYVQWSRPAYDGLRERYGIDLDIISSSWISTFWFSFILHDLCYFVWHLTSHKMAWLWTDHVVHHSSREFNFSTALRQSFVGFGSPGFLLSVAPLALFVPYEWASLQIQISLLYQFWIHTTLVPSLPVFQLLFNSPALHRAHHAQSSSCSFGGVLSVWDRLCGTFVVADDDEISYGVNPPLDSSSPLWANVEQWHRIVFRDCWYTALLSRKKQLDDPPVVVVDERRVPKRYLSYTIAQWTIAVASGLSLQLFGGTEFLARRIAQHQSSSQPLAVQCSVRTIAFVAVLVTLESVGSVLDRGFVDRRSEGARHFLMFMLLLGLLFLARLDTTTFRALLVGYPTLNCLWLATLENDDSKEEMKAMRKNKTKVEKQI